MTDFSRSGWLIYRLKGGDIETYGVLENEAKAREEIATLEGLDPGQKWETRLVWFIGWAMAMPVSNDERAGSRGSN